ncbi:TOBE-like domain-containing protein [Magnetospirillum sulfuroxidans]|uniref:TOBE-like domain-containing protein n=1 Tax=Magnetospirillum sulfuroxidans TaxID=611300 RepID=UPI003D1607E4
MAHWRTAATGLADGKGIAFIRPHEIDIDPHGRDATIRHHVVLGPTVRLDLRLDGDVHAEAVIDRDSHARLRLEPGQQVGLTARRIVVFAQD